MSHLISSQEGLIFTFCSFLGDWVHWKFSIRFEICGGIIGGAFFCPQVLYEELPWGRGTGWKLSHSWRNWGGGMGVVKIQYENWYLWWQLCQRGGLLVERLTLLENLWQEIFLIIWETDFMDFWTLKIFVGFFWGFRNIHKCSFESLSPKVLKDISFLFFLALTSV